jgi:membrane-bound lytic murein transglycosylase B
MKGVATVRTGVSGGARSRLLAASSLLVLATVSGATQLPPATVPAPEMTPPPFDVWLGELRAEAASRGIREEILERALTGIEPVARILERDRTQAEFVLDVDGYLKRRLTRGTIRTAQQMLARHRALLQRVSKRYGVPPRVIVAVWGLESNFGRFAGVRPTIPTLATLAYDPRRSTFFRQELFSALEILNRGEIELERLKGSWAGALGQPQFMPSSYLRYAQDFDEDGRRDIWTSQADVFASVAYYLQQHGWAEGALWGREVNITPAVRAPVEAVPTRETGCRAERLMSVPQPLSEWRRLGVRALANRALPTADIEASLIAAGARNFLAYSNYEALLKYNCAHTYALAVALLSDRIR